MQQCRIPRHKVARFRHPPYVYHWPVLRVAVISRQFISARVSYHGGCSFFGCGQSLFATVGIKYARNLKTDDQLPAGPAQQPLSESA